MVNSEALCGHQHVAPAMQSHSRGHTMPDSEYLGHVGDLRHVPYHTDTVGNRCGHRLLT
jgi:hypothetical protein